MLETPTVQLLQWSTDCNQIDKIAGKFVDIKELHNTKARVQDELHLCGHSFDAVCHLKEQM